MRTVADTSDILAPDDLAPDEMAAGEMAAGEMTALVQGLFFRPHLAALLQASAAAGMGVIVLKGAALAETLYPRPGLRPFGDLDVLIRPADAPRARVLLENLGYIVAPAVWDTLLQGEDTQANFFKHMGRGVVVVELHTDLLSNAFFRGHITLDADGLWSRARPARLADTDALVLGPEDQLLHLCLHLAGHYFFAPQSLRDIDLLCRTGTLDWPQFLRLAEAAHAAPVSFAALSAALTILETPIPAAVLPALAPKRGATRLAALAAARAADTSAGGAATERLRFPLLWGLLGTARARRSALRRTLLPEGRWLVTHYYHSLYNDPNDPRPHGSWDRGRLALRLYAAHFLFLARRAVGG